MQVLLFPFVLGLEGSGHVLTLWLLPYGVGRSSRCHGPCELQHLDGRRQSALGAEHAQTQAPFEGY